ncbi:hypothetical protein Vafri_3636 [Volvox africanus]|uniref:Uncharacterized protein n=1 Tax=Volvox africanus TaxID=51714 RepID=A0A8J4ET22_9CHLO|nr:hypothetical protein Vafri_3636 [Volvox africanus]
MLSRQNTLPERPLRPVRPTAANIAWPGMPPSHVTAWADLCQLQAVFNTRILERRSLGVGDSWRWMKRLHHELETAPLSPFSIHAVLTYLGCMYLIYAACTIYQPRCFCKRFECKRTCWDPKDGELCLSRVKPEETLVEIHRCADMQIAFRTWV